MYEENYYKHMFEIQSILRQINKKNVSTIIKKLNSYTFNNCYNDKSLSHQEYNTIISYTCGIAEGIQLMLSIDLRKEFK